MFMISITAINKVLVIVMKHQVRFFFSHTVVFKTASSPWLLLQQILEEVHGSCPFFHSPGAHSARECNFAAVTLDGGFLEGAITHV
jgi:hypothetical protein